MRLRDSDLKGNDRLPASRMSILDCSNLRTGHWPARQIVRLRLVTQNPSGFSLPELAALNSTTVNCYLSAACHNPGMGKIALSAALAALLLRMADNYLFFGKYTDAALFVTGQILRSFGL